MLFFMVTGYSEESEGTALANALGQAMALAEDAESVHVIILGMVQVGIGWQVSVKVVVEPRMEVKSRQKPGAPDQHKTEHEKDDEDQASLIHFYALSQTSTLLAEYLMEQTFEPYVHILTEGPLWDEAVNYYPDVEFYEAAHGEGIKAYETSHPDAQLALDRFVGRLREIHTMDNPAPAGG